MFQNLVFSEKVQIQYIQKNKSAKQTVSINKPSLKKRETRAIRSERCFSSSARSCTSSPIASSHYVFQISICPLFNLACKIFGILTVCILALSTPVKTVFVRELKPVAVSVVMDECGDMCARMCVCVYRKAGLDWCVVTRFPL